MLGAELITVVPMAWAVVLKTDGWWYGAMIGKTFLSFYALFAGMAAGRLRVVLSLPPKSSSLWLREGRAGGDRPCADMSRIGYISMTGLNEVALGFFL